LSDRGDAKKPNFERMGKRKREREKERERANLISKGLKKTKISLKENPQ
jgi:hypothetical protein